MRRQIASTIIYVPQMLHEVIGNPIFKCVPDAAQKEVIPLLRQHPSLVVYPAIGISLGCRPDGIQFAAKSPNCWREWRYSTNPEATGCDGIGKMPNAAQCRIPGSLANLQPRDVVRAVGCSSNLLEHLLF
ncbi:hypothetical protein amb3156 [Paramagnetospirillum magneticum AMB-1]|uniref:Uncharacterized protein n=1 Tax=Paramagnetospirillum magneticum (strain ATCC 700264 / AMB-1) TaxID=342108 RepID=Q2W2G5_PARM1|nr:hypothetical protein amb3156 [Paramagnetospirillum magneticum AMB-1]